MTTWMPYQLPLWARTDNDLIRLFEPMSSDDPSYEMLRLEMHSRGLSDMAAAKPLTSESPGAE